jgi:hypothetical protein
MYMVRELTENLSGQEELVDELDWYITPVINPDGYKYTQTDNRLWRKTRYMNDGKISRPDCCLMLGQTRTDLCLAVCQKIGFGGHCCKSSLAGAAN